MRSRQKGVALVSIMLIVVVVSAIAFQLYTMQSMHSAQVRFALEASIQRETLMASEALASSFLYEDWAIHNGCGDSSLSNPRPELSSESKCDGLQ